MKRLLHTALLTSLTLMAVACSGGIDPDAASTAGDEVIAGPDETEGKPVVQASDMPGNPAPANFERIRLPNMEDLPSDRELATTKPKEPTGGSGVIARPPSE